MKKYLTVFAVSWQNEFVYRLNFVLWRFRNILRLLMTYFLWRGVFASNASVYGYSQNQMLTYVFLVLVVQTFVTSAPSADNIGSEISNGDLNNSLVKPFAYLPYWFTRDLASKLLNIIFAVFEFALLWFVFQPQIQLSLSFPGLIYFLVSILSAMVIYFLLSVSARFTAFWMPENTWGLSFLLLVLLEILAGGIFPLNILPVWAQTALQFTPFPYLVYYPIAIILGKVSLLVVPRIIFQSVIWSAALYLLTRYVWHKGLSVYSAAGQ
jgi:ABC-2 type transport system permease protein